MEIVNIYHRDHLNLAEKRAEEAKHDRLHEILEEYRYIWAGRTNSLRGEVRGVTR